MLTTEDINWIYNNRTEISTNRQVEVTLNMITTITRDEYTSTPTELLNQKVSNGILKEYDQKNDFFLNSYGGELDKGTHVFVMDYIDDELSSDYIDYKQVKSITSNLINYGVLSTREVGIKRINKIYFLLQRKD